MPLLYGSPSRGGLGGVPLRSRRRNIFQEQLKRNPGFGKFTSGPQDPNRPGIRNPKFGQRSNAPPQEEEGGPKLATPLTQPEGGGSEISRIGEAVAQRPSAREFLGGTRESLNPVTGQQSDLFRRLNEASGGGEFQGFRSEAIPTSVAGLPGTNQGINKQVLQFLPQMIRRMMGV